MYGVVMGAPYEAGVVVVADEGTKLTICPDPPNVPVGLAAGAPKEEGALMVLAGKE